MYLSKLFLFLLSSFCWANTLKYEVEVRVPQLSAVEESAVRLGAIAQVYVRNISQFQAISNLEIAQFPADKPELIVPGEYIKQRILELVGDSKSVFVDVPQVVRFKRIAQEMDPAISLGEMATKIRARGLQIGKIPKGVDVVVELVSAPRSIVNAHSFEPAAETPHWKGEMTFKVVGTNSRGEQLNDWMRVRMRWYAERWISKRDIRFQEDVFAENFIKHRVELTQIKENPVLADTAEEFARLLNGVRAKRSIKAQAILTDVMLDRKPDLRSGQGVRVVFVSPSGLRVETEGQAVQESHVGAETRVRLKRSKKIVTGNLINANQLEVSL